MKAELRTVQRQAAWQRSAADELVNAVTHGVGLVLAIVGALVMAGSVLRRGDAWQVAGCGVYLASLVAVYAASTLSHSCCTPQWKFFFRRLDQGFIFLLIAATFTPFGLAYLRTGPGWLLLGAMWAVALGGFFSKVVFAHRVEAVSIWIYVALGWLPTVAVPSLMHTVPVNASWCMLSGGICYTLGTLFLIYDARIRYFHAVWHLLVIAGSACHFLGILVAVARFGG